MSTCLGNIMEGDDIAPQFKRLKISSENSQGSEVKKESLIGDDLLKELKFVFPYLNEEKIKEVVEKSQNNAERAKEMIREFNNDEISKIKNFVNLHPENKKRKFNEMIVSGGGVRNQINPFAAKKESEREQRSKPDNLQARKITQLNKNVHFQNYAQNKNQINQINSQSDFTDEELENFLSLIEKSQSREEIKNIITGMISNKSKSTNNQNPQLINSTLNLHLNEEKKKLEEIKTLNENLITDNTELKKCVITLYRKVENDKKLKEENLKLQNRIDDLEDEILKEKSRNQSMAMLFRQYENSSIGLFEGKNIY